MKRNKYHLIVLGIIIAIPSCQILNKKSFSGRVDVVKTPPCIGKNSWYVSSRPPLHPNPLIKLPVGSIEPKGWLLHQLQLMQEGFVGNLQKISRFLKPDSGWLTFEGGGWEEMPYWLRGYGDIGYILKDSDMIIDARRWIDAAIFSQDSDGYFGPPENKERHDIWPNMLMLYAFRSMYEATGDARIIPFLTRYFWYQNNLPDKYLIPRSWQKYRGGENLESIYWLYNRTGDEFLLKLAQRNYKNTHNWETDILSTERDNNWKPSSFYHGVNITMGLRYPGIYYQQSKDPKHLECVKKNLKLILDNYGQQPGGMFGADENIRPGYQGPRQAAETCSMVELMHSYESLLKITGEIDYADRCEEIAFNSLPSSMTPDLKGLHYLTAPNLISCDSSGSHDYENGGDMLSFNPWKYRCCQHNVSFGWPYFAEHLWFATLDNGLAALLYAPAQISAKVSGKRKVKISVNTGYPFEGQIRLTILIDDPVTFPLYLRIPGWCEDAQITINGQKLNSQFKAGTFAVIKRKWRNSDYIQLFFPMTIHIKTWKKMANSVSVRRGPLWYSLKIGEEWKRCEGTDKWPGFEVFPTTPWNYGLVLDSINPESSIYLKDQKSVPFQPFSMEDAPITLQAKAKRIPGWISEGKMVGKLPCSPVASQEKVESVTLIPMGCARLRISSFPVIQNP
jgi:hypothetical protein